ncbi:tyrosine-protein phosphatase [Halalkalibacillus halophilus]|uniref:tyrosine-protein phosphatase n=1 Tax=Halalkalibacillus halophilus TaxID=392827 RepID=UPI00040248B9|nr:CpsB/CapC family capsule biosynthesis tyrosine phosphatase [Halalkalibacillus halophilus]
MIDIHSHILPGVDDGAQTMEDSLDMARAAVEAGISTIYATPHHLNGRYENEQELVVKEVKKLQKAIEKELIPLTVLPGQEIRINGEAIEHLHNDTAMTLGGNTNYALIEFPSSSVPRFSKHTLFDLQMNQVKPIIVHPERNGAFLKHSHLLFEFVKRGSLTQLTASSVAGVFGKKIQNFSFQLLESNLVHFIASDAHRSTGGRSFHMKEAYDVITDRFGQELTDILQENAELVMNNEQVIVDPPVEVKKKKLLGIF